VFILETLKHHLMHPDLVKEFITAFNTEVNRERKRHELGFEHKKSQLAETTRRLNGLIEAIADGLRSPGLQQKLEELEQQKRRLEGEIESEPLPKPRLDPNMGELYRRQISKLEEALEDPASREEASALLRNLVQRVELKPGKKGLEVEFVGDIAQMIAVAHPERKLEVDRYKSSLKVVAEERSHLCFRLLTARIPYRRSHVREHRPSHGAGAPRWPSWSPWRFT